MVWVLGAQLGDFCLDASVAAEASLGRVGTICAGLDVLIKMSMDVVDVEEGCLRGSQHNRSR